MHLVFGTLNACRKKSVFFETENPAQSPGRICICISRARNIASKMRRQNALNFQIHNSRREPRECLLFCAQRKRHPNMLDMIPDMARIKRFSNLFEEIRRATKNAHRIHITANTE